MGGSVSLFRGLRTPHNYTDVDTNIVTVQSTSEVRILLFCS